MFKQVRRSLGERLVESTVPRHVCIRRIHAQNPIRGAAAQVQQGSAPLSGIQSYPTKKSAQEKRRHADNSSPPTNSSSRSSQKPSSKAISGGEEDIPTEDPLKSATSLNSPHHWGKNTISKLYEPPTEEEIPAQLERRSKATDTTKVFDWRERPFQYLEEGLKLALKMESVNIRRKGVVNTVRVKLSAHWANDGHITIGDGPSKVLSPLEKSAYSKEIALNNAALHMIMKDKSSPMFADAVCVAKYKNVSQETILTNKTAKVDVYDYAAQFDTVPVFETRTLPSSNKRNGPKGFFTRVTVHGTVIVGESFHPTVRAYAELGACVNFKKRAEELHQGETMMVKHINTLTSKTGEKFLQYCKMKQKDWEQFKFVAKSINGVEVLGQLHLGDRLLSECVMLKYNP